MILKKDDINTLKIATISFIKDNITYNGKFISWDENKDKFYNYVLDNITALATTKGGKLILGYHKNYPEMNEIKNIDILDLLNKIKSDTKKNIVNRENGYDPIIESIRINQIRNKPVIIIN